jgi:hypothetical protein
LLEEAAKVLATRGVGVDGPGQHDAVDTRCKRRRHLHGNHGPGVVADDGRPFDAQRVEDVDGSAGIILDRRLPGHPVGTAVAGRVQRDHPPLACEQRQDLRVFVDRSRRLVQQKQGRAGALARHDAVDLPQP